LVAIEGLTEKPDSTEAMDIERCPRDGVDAKAASSSVKAGNAIDTAIVGESERTEPEPVSHFD
jgi:hypothetical protein